MINNTKSKRLRSNRSGRTSAGTNDMLPIPDGSSFRIELATGRRWDYFYHTHSCYELIHIHHGYGEYVVGDYEGHIRGGELILVAPGVAHTFYTDGFLLEEQILQANILWFSFQLVQDRRLPEMESLSPLLQRARYGISFSWDTTAAAAELIGSFFRTQGARSLGVFYRLLDILSADKDAKTLAQLAPDTARNNPEIARLGEICKHMRRHYTDPLALEELAEQFDISVSTLNGLMKKYRHTTFLRLLTEIRLEAARRLLVDEEETITDVAYKAGFNSLPTFNRRFREHSGVTPREYRKQHRA